MNVWQRKAQEKYPFGAISSGEGGITALEVLDAEVLIEHLAYEQQGCDNCSGTGEHQSNWSATYATCPTCRGTGLDPDYRKAQEWAVKLGVE